MRITRTLPVLLLLLAMRPLWAQPLPEFPMRDTVVTVCKGILLDSELGPNEMIYGNNEDFTFTIDAGNTITLVFDPVFCTEQGLDVLTFHDGPTINAPQIGPAYSGIVAPPPIVATSGFLTVHFVSDENVAYCGWEAQWTSEVEPPVPPVMTIPVAPQCGTNTVDLQFSFPVACDSIVMDACTISGNGAPQVTGVQPVGCGGGETQQMQLTVDEPFDRDCPYTVSFRIGLLDRCDSLWYFTLTANTAVNTCPLGVQVLVEEDTLCAGGCTTIRADVQGCQTYTYSWSDGLASVAGPQSVCPTATTTYTVTVVEQQTGEVVTGTATLVVHDPQITSQAGSICQSIAPFDLVAVPPGGAWSGAGIVDSLAGTLDPDTAGPGTHTYTYTLPNGCSDVLTIAVDSMDAGLPQAACPGTAPFQLTGFTPMGGTWSGPNVSASGVFDPQVVGSYVLTYAAGACSDTMRVNVDDLVAQTQLDTVCQSTWPFDIPASPFGGRWSGPGITDTIMGTFDPDDAGGGDHVLMYALHGCDLAFTIHVKPVDIGDSHSACPSQAPAPLYPNAVPLGGAWSGAGITDAVTGMYDPVVAGDGWDEVTYAAPNGCVDTIGILVGWTSLDADTLFFCAGDEPLELNEATTGRTPWDGAWSGNGIAQDADGHWWFDPAVAGVGAHWLTYAANACLDSMLAVVHPLAIGLPDMTLCASTGPFLLANLPPGGAWSGVGVVDAIAGVYSPGAAGNGTHLVRFDAPAGCSDSLTITVIPFQQAVIGGVDEVYCGNNELVTIDLFPPGGVFTGMNDTVFNPKSIAPGTYTLIYSYGSGACFSSDTLTFVNHPALTTQFSVSQNPICDGGGSVLAVEASGGFPGASITHQWNQGLFPIAQQSVVPDSTTTYMVMTSDGCSDPIIDSVVLIVHPPFTPQFSFSDTACFGEPGHVEGSVVGQGSYTFVWNEDPALNTAYVEAPAGELLTVVVTNDGTGCAQDTLVQVPSWPALTALFSINPNLDCVPFEDRTVALIDLSNNAVSGTWTIDTTNVPYVLGENPTWTAPGAGSFPVSLFVQNIGGCVDSMALELCIAPSTDIFIPDVFSPNGDGSNDLLFVRGGGIAEMTFNVYDRWGGQVFSTTDQSLGWDGRASGGPVPSGVYVYTLQATMRDGASVELSGDITLVR